VELDLVVRRLITPAVQDAVTGALIERWSGNRRSHKLADVPTRSS
jgi:hypothetical protein